MRQELSCAVLGGARRPPLRRHLRSAIHPLLILRVPDHVPASRTLQVCALWTPEVAVWPGPGCAVVEGARSLRPERYGGTCALCGLTEGVVLRCNAGHCAAAAHALCARNAGHYLAVCGRPTASSTPVRVTARLRTSSSVQQVQNQ